MITVLSGGVGAARFLEGMVSVVAPENITSIVNTGDDFTLHGLHIAPDVDIVTCTLAGVIHTGQGWGIQDDSFACLEWLGKLGASTWFQLGDRDLALHIQRTAMLRAGATLTDVADHFRRALGVAVRILPMSDDPQPTHIITPAGEFHFEQYLVQRRATDAVLDVRFVGNDTARPTPAVLHALHHAERIVIAPSNPVVSIGPILALAGVRAAIRESAAPVIAISPIVGGAAIKGPAVPLMQAIGLPATALGVAQAYQDLLDTLIIDQIDAHLQTAIEALGINVIVTNTIMRGAEEKAALARTVVSL